MIVGSWYIIMCIHRSLQLFVFLIHYHLAGADYSSTIRLLTLNGSHSRIWVLVPIVHDVFIELNKQFRASLSLFDDKGINVSVHPDQSTVEIINGDSK